MPEDSGAVPARDEGERRQRRGRVVYAGTTPGGLGHEWRLVSPSTQCLWTVILHVADLLETGLNIALSGRFAC